MPEEPPTDPEATSRDRPETEASYGIPTDREGMLSWSFVAETLAGQRDYWVTTVRPDGRPHARPTWGVWVDDRFHCGGGERTRWVRNLATDPSVVVHSLNVPTFGPSVMYDEPDDAGIYTVCAT